MKSWAPQAKKNRVRTKGPIIQVISMAEDRVSLCRRSAFTPLRYTSANHVKAMKIGTVSSSVTAVNARIR